MGLVHQAARLPFMLMANKNVGFTGQLHSFLPHRDAGQAHLQCGVNMVTGNLVVQHKPFSLTYCKLLYFRRYADVACYTSA